MRKLFLTVGVIALMSSPIVFAADVNGIEIIFSKGDKSQFTKSEDTQHIYSLNGANVYLKNGDIIQFTKTDISGSFTNITDQSAGGTAKAIFGSGSWDAQLWNPSDNNDVVLHLSGTVDWYEELETASNTVKGKGIVTVTYTDVDQAYWGSGAKWDATGNKSGIRTQLSQCKQGGGSLMNYQSDWYSNNGTLFIYADSSAIPEPATICLLGLGGLALLRRKK